MLITGKFFCAAKEKPRLGISLASGISEND
jgi:hypothetical protein